MSFKQIQMFNVGPKLFEFTIDGIPVQALKMSSSRSSIWGMYKQHKAKVAIDIATQFNYEKINHAVHLQVDFLLPIPSTLESNDIREEEEPHLKEPTTGNLIRFVEEALLDSIFEDIVTIPSICAVKYYSSNPKTTISIYHLE